MVRIRHSAGAKERLEQVHKVMGAADTLSLQLEGIFNGQHNVAIGGNTAAGVSFSQIKMIRETDGNDALTDYSVRYDDKYIFNEGRWLINALEGHFVIIEERELSK